MTTDICDGCHRKIAGGRDACRSDFERLLARDYSDPLFFRTHRLFVDTYALQHPDQFCASAKSFAAHFLDLCAILQRGASPATGYEPLQLWLTGNFDFEKPRIPTYRGSCNLEFVADLNTPEAWAAMLQEWAKSTWDAYGKLQPWARHFLNNLTPSPPS